jgi:ATP-binding cassette subfamily B protein
LRDLIQKQLDLNGKMNTIMAETLNVSGALLVKLFGRQADEVEKFATRADEVAAIGVRQSTVGRWFFMLLGLISAVGTAVVYAGGGYLVLQGTFTVGTIVAFAAYLTNLYAPVAQLTNARVDLATSLVSFERVFAMLDLPVEIADSPDALVLDRARGELAFDGVSFTYLNEMSSTLTQSPSNDEVNWTTPQNSRGQNGHNGDETPALPGAVSARLWALRKVSFKIAPGQLVALVGPSGAGKTTITYLIPRLYDPTEGSIFLDGHDLRSLNLASLEKQIGMVTQETYLFHDTIRANLLFANPEATEAEITRASKAANIHDFIAKLPQGYETIVGERGYRLSGGEKQRVAIARVILKDPRILILDEATSSLDSESEVLIQDALKPLMRDRTTIAIAHRLSTILAADMILVIDEGSVSEFGTHEALLRQNGLYARLYHAQFRENNGLRV